MQPLQYRKANPITFKLISQGIRHQLTLRGYEAIIDAEEQFVKIKNTNFAISWCGTENDKFGCEVLTNYTRDGKYCPMRNAFGGQYQDCVTKALNTHEYFKKLNNR